MLLGPLYGQGVSRTGELLDLALQQGLIAKNGAWFSYQATHIGQGRVSKPKLSCKLLLI